jgi:hypothetical protein
MEINMNNQNQFLYMPILKWKQGEQGALIKVDDHDRKHLVPLIELQPMVIRGSSTRAEVIKADATKLLKILTQMKGQVHPVAIDASLYIQDPSKQVQIVSSVCTPLYQNGFQVIPVIYPSMLPLISGKSDPLSKFNDIILRIKTPMYLHSQVNEIISNAYKLLHRKSFNLHVLIDLGSVVDSDPSSLSINAFPYIDEAIVTNKASTITLAGGSFPFNLTGIPKGTTLLPRIEWLTWLKTIKKFRDHHVCFGDYSVTNPEILGDIDPTKINPSAAIRYALNDDWMLLKAGGTRTSGFNQYNQLCQLLISDPDYSGQGFSFGDDRYYYHAQAGSPTGNLSTWRRDATSHHLALTVRNCATLFGI